MFTCARYAHAPVNTITIVAPMRGSHRRWMVTIANHITSPSPTQTPVMKDRCWRTSSAVASSRGRCMRKGQITYIGYATQKKATAAERQRKIQKTARRCMEFRLPRGVRVPVMANCQAGAGRFRDHAPGVVLHFRFGEGDVPPVLDDSAAGRQVRDLHAAQEADLEIDGGEGLAIPQRAGVGDAHGAVHQGAEHASMYAAEEVGVFRTGLHLDDRRADLHRREPETEKLRERGSGGGLLHDGAQLLDHSPSIAGYSMRSASQGFVDAARRAGAKLASRAAVPRIPATARSVSTSHDRTPNSRLCASVPAMTAPAAPRAMPNSASRPPSRRIIWYTARCCAPSAMRTPISRVRWLTE